MTGQADDFGYSVSDLDKFISISDGQHVKIERGAVKNDGLDDTSV